MNENEIYAVAENELRTGNYDETLWEKVLIDNEGNRSKAEEEYIKIRTTQIRGSNYNDTEIRTTHEEVSESHPSREPVKSRNIFLGITLLILIIVLVVIIGFLLHDYFNVR